MAFAPSFAPRLDLRQSQSLVMTPQLRQAIQLLQFSNLEASAFIEDELLKNPLLECETGGETVTAIETRAEALAIIPDDPASIAAAGMLPDSATTSLDLDTSNVYDAGTNADGYGAAGFPAVEFNLHSPNLSDAFMTLTGRALRDYDEIQG